MIARFGRVMLLSLLLSLGTFIPVSHAQQAPVAPASIEVVQVIGLVGVKQNTKGSLKVENGSLTFAHSKSNCEVAAASIQDVVTGRDSQRAVGGRFKDRAATIGSLSATVVIPS